jgi:hypothetical protein
METGMRSVAYDAIERPGAKLGSALPPASRRKSPDETPLLKEE